MLPCASVRTLSEEHEAIIIVANHSHIIWVREHIGQSAVFKNPLKSAQMLVKKNNKTIQYWLVPKSVLSETNISKSKN